MENKTREVKDMMNLLEKSIIPLMAEMIKAMGEHSYRYESYIKDIKEKIDNMETTSQEDEETKKDILEEMEIISEFTKDMDSKRLSQEKAFNILTKTITTFGEKLTNLIGTNNKLVNYQQLQINKMDKVIASFEENTARLDTLTLAMEDKSYEREIYGEMKSNHPLFRDLGEEIESEPIKKVLDDEIQRLKNSTKG